MNVDRYDDRDFVDVNLVASYDRIITFVQKHLPDPFYLEGTARISLRDSIFREVASNILIHREYTSAFPAKLIIERGRVRTENSSRPHGFGRLDPKSFTPFPKNPVIARFFRQIGRADELGSGMRNLSKFSRAYGGAEAELVEGDVFRMMIQVPESVGESEEQRYALVVSTERKVHDHGPDVTDTEFSILLACLEEPKSTQSLLNVLGYSTRTGNFREALARLIDDLGLLERTAPDTPPRSKKQKYRLTPKGRSFVEIRNLKESE